MLTHCWGIFTRNSGLNFAEHVGQRVFKFCSKILSHFILLLKAAEDPPLPEIYSCQKCEFQHRSREDFQRHIKKHFNASIDDFQCTECGNTYTSLSSLEKHLFMTHKVRNFQLQVFKPIEKPHFNRFPNDYWNLIRSDSVSSSARQDRR